MRSLTPRRLAFWVGVEVATRLAKRCQSRLSFSQFGEDLVLDDLFADREDGCYVDVGAHHPRRLSNTFALYRRGWSGVAIDPTSAAAASFRLERPRDRFFQTAVATDRSTRTLFVYSDSAMNTLRSEVVRSRNDRGLAEIGEVQVAALPLREILERARVPSRFELLAVDTEGADLDVLLSSDWQKWKPKVVCVEALSDGSPDPIPFLLSKGYQEWLSLGRSRILVAADATAELRLTIPGQSSL